jgi:hypothetical protein
MAHQRSPNCPQVAFQEAAERGRLLYQKEHTHPASKEVVAQSLGYSGLNGRSLSMIGALRQYGIIEGQSDAMRVSDDAVAYFELDSGPDRDASLSRMIFAPSVFAQIHTDFGDTLPSEQNLKHYLIKMGFLPKTAEDVIAIYRENIRLVENKGVVYDDNMNVQPSMASSIPRALVPSSLPQVVADNNFVLSDNSYTLPLGRGSSAVIQLNGDITEKSLKLLRSQIELLISALSSDEADATETQDPKTQ